MWRYKEIQENRRGKIILKKLITVFLWLVLAAGIYWCNVSTQDLKEHEGITENEDKKQEEDTKDLAGGITQKEEEISRVEALSDTIRVLIKTDGFQGIYHGAINIVRDSGMIVEYGNTVTECGSGEEFLITKELFQDHSEVLKVTAKDQGVCRITNLKRSAEASYRGTMECYGTSEGIVLVNELKVEEYLYGVVPSEMPSSYPAEALKAQAISARTYTYFHKKSYAYPEWKANVDDSTAFQVYKNIEETAEAVLAVNDTRNEVLTYDGEVIESFYYSTSSGYNGGARVWSELETFSDNYLYETGEDIFAENNTEGEAAYQQFIDNGNPSDPEFGEAWYRWNYDKSLEGEACRTFLQKLYELSNAQPQNVRIRSQYLSKEKILEECAVKDIRILKRHKSGLVTGIIIETQNFMVSVRTQHVIRQAFGTAGDTLVKKDGSQYSLGDLLASAYFYIEKKYGNTGSDNNAESGDNLREIVIHGAGLGHGCGMSQNGAKCLADRGCTAYEILAYYYNGAIMSVDSLK